MTRIVIHSPRIVFVEALFLSISIFFFYVFITSLFRFVLVHAERVIIETHLIEIRASRSLPFNSLHSVRVNLLRRVPRLPGVNTMRKPNSSTWIANKIWCVRKIIEMKRKEPSTFQMVDTSYLNYLSTCISECECVRERGVRGAESSPLPNASCRLQLAMHWKIAWIVIVVESTMCALCMKFDGHIYIGKKIIILHLKIKYTYLIRRHTDYDVSPISN